MMTFSTTVILASQDDPAAPEVSATVVGRPSARKVVLLKVGDRPKPKAGKITFKMEKRWRVSDEKAGRMVLLREERPIVRVFVKMCGDTYMGETRETTWTKCA